VLKKTISTLTRFIIFIIVFSYFSCSNLFEYSPYETNLDEKYINTTQKNLNKIQSLTRNDSTTFQFAVVTDTHYLYSDLADAIKYINRNSTIQFVLYAGDITEYGLKKDFELFYEMNQKLNVPYLTVIGNHDYLSNGKVIYTKMFGDLNYSFNFNKTRFIMFDDIFWESNRTPNFSWLNSSLSKSKELFNNQIVISHIAPFDQFDSTTENYFQNILSENNVMLSIHGHNHAFSYYPNYYKNGVDYLIAPWVRERQYSLITVYSNSYSIEIVSY